MREFLFRRFGAGQPESVAERETAYLAGMPNSNGEVFPPRCNMEDKLNALEKEREYLLDMCPTDKQDTYDNGKESTLVRIILANLPEEYDGAVKECRSLLRIRKANESGTLNTISNIEDNVRKNYSVDWLPEYSELRVELLNSFYLQERRRKQSGKIHKGVTRFYQSCKAMSSPDPSKDLAMDAGKLGAI
jgi:hypothetical protein